MLPQGSLSSAVNLLTASSSSATFGRDLASLVCELWRAASYGINGTVALDWRQGGRFEVAGLKVDTFAPAGAVTYDEQHRPSVRGAPPRAKLDVQHDGDRNRRGVAVRTTYRKD